jgi:hypothetical protein
MGAFTQRSTHQEFENHLVPRPRVAAAGNQAEEKTLAGAVVVEPPARGIDPFTRSIVAPESSEKAPRPPPQ